MMKYRILILFAHPRMENSQNNKVLRENIPDIAGITFNDLYENYADFNIDINREKRLLSEHDIIILMHPFYWYSVPPLMKQWIDIVLEFGWAYGPGGNALQGKLMFNTITTGGQRSAYSRDGHNRFTVNELLAPVNQTAHLCKMVYLPPFTVHGTHRLTPEELMFQAGLFREVLIKFAEGNFDIEEIRKHPCLNDWIESTRK